MRIAVIISNEDENSFIRRYYEGILLYIDNLHLDKTFKHLQEKTPDVPTMTALPLRVRSFETAESYQKALSTQPVTVKDQYQKASYYDYRKKELVTGWVQVAKDLPLIGLTYSIGGIHTPYVSELVDGVIAQWVGNVELYQARVMAKNPDLKAYLKSEYSDVLEHLRLGAFKTDAQIAGLATLTVKELRNLRKALEGYLELPKVKEAMEMAEDLQVSMAKLTPYLGAISLDKYEEGDMLSGKKLLKEVRDEFLIGLNLAIESISAVTTEDSDDTLYIALGKILGTPVKDLSEKIKPSITKAYA
jgi:hypothetical protein